MDRMCGFRDGYFCEQRTRNFTSPNVRSIIESRIGVRVWNLLSSFLPTDVQSNLGSRAFGSFYNSEYRSFHIQVRFER